MLKLKPLTLDWLAVSAHIPTVIFIMPQKVNPQTCTCIRLLGPCCKTGQMKHQVEIAAKHTPEAKHFPKAHNLANIQS